MLIYALYVVFTLKLVCEETWLTLDDFDLIFIIKVAIPNAPQASYLIK